MTNEEAIKYLIAPITTSTEPSAEYLKQKEAYDLAIQALETGEIYISGEDYNLYMRGYKAGKKDFEPKQGKWITDGVGNITCSNCGFSLGSKVVKLLYPFDFSYCPDCGADMRKGDEEE